MEVDFSDILRRCEAGEIGEEEKEALLEAARTGEIARHPAYAEGVVYYVRTCCRVKIGFTTDLVSRIKALSPDELLATERGTFETERMRHRQFEADRVRGEWFHESPAIRAHIVALRVRHHTADTDNPGERMITTASAVAYTGRDRQVLYRWVKEGRIDRYGTASEALWDVFQLPARKHDGTFGAPPPKRS